jgi:succinate dehydrogenase / fumarate reductase cytochrome b subunit
VKDKRPVNLDIGTFELPITAYVSLLHRTSGVISVIGVAVLLWILDASLSSEESFNAIKAGTDSFLCKLIVWGVLSALTYHTVAGVKHLIMDLGVGETMEGGVLGSKITLVTSAVLIGLLGVWIW